MDAKPITRVGLGLGVDGISKCPNTVITWFASHLLVTWFCKLCINVTTRAIYILRIFESVYSYVKNANISFNLEK